MEQFRDYVTHANNASYSFRLAMTSDIRSLRHDVGMELERSRARFYSVNESLSRSIATQRELVDSVTTSYEKKFLEMKDALAQVESVRLSTVCYQLLCYDPTFK